MSFLEKIKISNIGSQMIEILFFWKFDNLHWKLYYVIPTKMIWIDDYWYPINLFFDKIIFQIYFILWTVWIFERSLKWTHDFPISNHKPQTRVLGFMHWAQLFFIIIIIIIIIIICVKSKYIFLLFIQGWITLISSEVCL